MPIRKMLRESAFKVARQDLASFLNDHEDELIQIFREEMEKLDEEIPEESFFIDIKMVPLGETILKAALHAIRRFLTEDLQPAERPLNPASDPDEDAPGSLTLKDTQT